MKTKFCYSLIGGAVSLLTLAAYLARGENQQAHVLRPLDKSVLPCGPVEIAVIVPDGTDLPRLVLDGEHLPISSSPATAKGESSPLKRPPSAVFLPPAYVTTRTLSPGLHKLSVGKTIVQFFVTDKEGKRVPPTHWRAYVAHPPAPVEGASCTACHELSEQRRFTNMTTTFSLEKPSTCFDCHAQPDFKLTHNHRYESLAFCQMCHDPHGGTDAQLLKLPQKEACTLCHE